MIRCFVFMCAVLAGCGGGGGGAASLQGTWFGTIETANANLYSFEMTIDGSDQLTSVRIDGGEVLAGGPIPLVKKTALTYFTATDDVMLMFDATLRHALVVTVDHDFSVVQKGASSLPTFTDADIAGSYGGRVALVDDFFALADEYGSNVVIDTDGTFSGTDADGTTITEDFLPLLLDTSAWGFYLGNFFASNLESGHFAALMSPDKRFLAAYTCPYGYDASTDPLSVCSLRVYRK